MAGVFAFGTKINRWDGVSAYELIPRLGSISGPTMTNSPIETTTHDDVGGFRTKVPGLTEPGQVSAELNLDWTLQMHNDLYADFVGKVVLDTVGQSWQLEFVDGTTLEYYGWISQFEPQEPVDNVQKANLVWELTGLPVLA